jgi:Mg-chelatase subunit ChlD
MSKQLVNPLQALVKQAAKSLPVTTGAVAAQQKRLDRRSGDSVILADISHSMNSPAWGELRKIDVLRQAVAASMQQTPCRLIAFSAHAREVQAVPEPEANTNLAAGLRAAQALDPGVTLVISDGQPDNPAEALAVARTFRGAIDVLYVGPDSDAVAIAFMQKLAQAADGQVRVNDIGHRAGAQQLLTHLAALLPGPRA